RHEEADHAILTLELQREAALELQRGREKDRGAHRLAQQLTYGGWIVGMRPQLTPGGIEPHPVPANRLVLDNETTDFIGTLCDARSLRGGGHGPQHGAPRTIVQPRAWPDPNAPVAREE